LGGLSRLIPAGLSLLLVPSMLAAPVAQEPAPILANARTPDGRPILLRFQFRKGLSAEGKALPRAFLRDREADGWVPFESLSPEGKRWALAALFPEDQWRQDEVRHTVRHPDVESVWTMAALFTGHGQNYDRLIAENPDLPEKLREGDVWRIPLGLLSKDLGGTGRGPDRTQPEHAEHEAAAHRARGQGRMAQRPPKKAARPAFTPFMCRPAPASAGAPGGPPARRPRSAPGPPRSVSEQPGRRPPPGRAPSHRRAGRTTSPSPGPGPGPP